jgi:hypothetical protein
MRLYSFIQLNVKCMETELSMKSLEKWTFGGLETYE